MKAHELANKLLQGPDLPIVINGWGSDEGSSFEVTDLCTTENTFNGDGDTKDTPRDGLGYNTPRPAIILGHCDRTPESDLEKALRENRNAKIEEDRARLSDRDFNLMYATCRGLTPEDFSKLL